VLVTHDPESDDQCDFDEDESELDPETYSKDAVFAVMDTQALILGADEDCRDDVASTVLEVSILPRNCIRANGTTYMKTQSIVSCTV